MTTPDIPENPEPKPLIGVWQHSDGSRVEIIQSGLWWRSYAYKTPQDTRPQPDGTQEFRAEEPVRDLIRNLQQQGFARDPHGVAGVPPQYEEARSWFDRIIYFWRS